MTSFSPSHHILCHTTHVLHRNVHKFWVPGNIQKKTPKRTHSDMPWTERNTDGGYIPHAREKFLSRQDTLPAEFSWVIFEWMRLFLIVADNDKPDASIGIVIVTTFGERPNIRVRTVANVVDPVATLGTPVGRQGVRTDQVGMGIKVNNPFKLHTARHALDMWQKLVMGHHNAFRHGQCKRTIGEHGSFLHAPKIQIDTKVSSHFRPP